MPADGMFQFLNSRERNAGEKVDNAVTEAIIARQLPLILREKTYSLGEHNKIFSSAWLNDSNVICGSKCNKIIVINLISKKILTIPTLTGSPNAPVSRRNCGIHSIAVNQSKTMLATGGENPNSIGVYSLPSLEPLTIGEFHKDWVFSLTWISPNLLASGSRDGSVAIWDIREHCIGWFTPPLPYTTSSPSSVIQNVEMIDKVRDLVYNTDSKELAAISSNGFIHFLNAGVLKKTASIPLPHCQENVCLARENFNRMYAVGSLSHVCFIDARTCSLAGSICSTDQGAGVRSLSFRDNVLTIGTGLGSILFYDLRAQKFLERPDNTPCHYKVGNGFLRKDSIYEAYFWDLQDAPNAVYTHCYNEAKTKLFTAGGPLALSLYGNYAGLWE